MDFSYEYDLDVSDAQVMEFLEEFGPALLGGVLVFLLVLLIWGIISYVFTALGFYTVAKRRGIQNPWLAWIPVANLWLLGSISDQYQYVVKGKITNRRTILLVLSIVSFCVSFVVSLVAELVAVFAAYSTAADVMMAVSGLTSLVTSVVSIVSAVFQYIALYDYYTSCTPANNVLYLVLGIIFGFLQPFFIFFSRNKDGGMPPRRNVYSEPRYMPAQPSYTPAQQSNQAVDSEHVRIEPEYAQPETQNIFHQPEPVSRPEPETDPWDRPDNI